MFDDVNPVTLELPELLVYTATPLLNVNSVKIVPTSTSTKSSNVKRTTSIILNVAVPFECVPPVTRMSAIVGKIKVCCC
jgi:hypothetical protein